MDATNTAEYTGNASETIDGAASQTLTENKGHTVRSDGANWYLVG